MFFFYLRLKIMHCKVPLPPAEDGIQTHKKIYILNIMKKVNLFLLLISESETHILYRFITQSEIFQAFVSQHFFDYGLQIMKTQS